MTLPVSATRSATPSTPSPPGTPPEPRPRAVSRVLRPFQEFARIGSLGGIVLLIVTAIALSWANSPWGESYFHLWETEIVVGSAASPLSLTLHEWINDLFMAVFFLLVGLEIKREMLVGELSSPRQAALPIIAAIGGMVVPALCYFALNRSGPGMAGWGIPMATDIAFALGILAVLGPRVPLGLKVFLAALAIVDDLGAVLVIAFFYTGSIAWGALAGAALCVALLAWLNYRRIGALSPYLVIGVVLWYCVLASGVHATIAGVVLAMTIPTNSRINAEEFSARARALVDEFDRTETGDLLVITSKGQQEALHGLDVAVSSVNAPLLKLEHGLNMLVSFGIMPLFALANAGVRLDGAAAALTSPAALGIMAGLVVGKMAGITALSVVAVRSGIASLPAGVTWPMLHGVAWLGGIGFTMSLFIAGLAFDNVALRDASKIGVLVSSVLAGTVGFLLVRRAAPAGGAGRDGSVEKADAGDGHSGA